MNGSAPHLQVVSSSRSPSTSEAAASLALRSDDELMLLARGGMVTAFDELVRRHQGRVLRVAARRLARRELAPDVAQNAFLDLYRALPRYEPRGRFEAYLFRAVVNQCRMTERSARREGRLRAPLLSAGAEIEAQPVSAPDTSAEARILARERERDLERAVARLSPKLKDVVSLRYAGGLGYDQIAETLGIPVGTVKRRVFDAVEKLRNMLEEP
jgi:RNA polymerase sigma-70 factor (ECF subfamily)